MRLFLFIILFFTFNIFFVSARSKESKVDTIVNSVMTVAENFGKYVEQYEAEIYMRTYIFTMRKNFLYKYAYRIPDFVLYDRKNKEAIIETLNRVHFQYPDNYDYTVTHINGTLTSKRDVFMLPFNLLNVNVYAEVTNDGSFLLPARFESKRYYKYVLQSVFEEKGKTCYVIRIFSRI
ncbi:MAG: DUF5686 family protein [Paludibacteraceae bacterium]